MARSLLTELESLRRPVALEPEGGLNLDDELKRYEIGLIRVALDKADGSQTRAARMLGVKVTTLNTKIKRYQIMCRKW
jgi:transcriptional regulator with GAF, ATPase, and Fis domain